MQQRNMNVVSTDLGYVTDAWRIQVQIVVVNLSMKLLLIDCLVNTRSNEYRSANPLYGSLTMRARSMSSSKRRRYAIYGFPLLFLCMSIFSCSSDAAVAKRMVFALTNSRDSNLEKLLEQPSIDGVAFQEGWAMLEPRAGEYNWSTLDRAIYQVRVHRKYVSIHLLASPRTPGWLSTVGAQYFSGTDFRGREIADVVPWDKVYLERYTRFLKALADHLSETGATPNVFALGVVVPVAECNLVGCRNDMIGDVRYDRNLYLTACKQMIDAYAEAFPGARLFVSPPVRDMICFPQQDSKFFKELMDYAIAKHHNKAYMFAADLNSQGSERTRPYLEYSSKTGLGFQTIWSSTNDPSIRMKGAYPSNLLQSINYGINCGGSYFEIYAVDVLNHERAIQQAIQRIHQ